MENIQIIKNILDHGDYLLSSKIFGIMNNVLYYKECSR